MFVIAYYPETGSKLYMTKKDGCYLCCGCPFSARLYKTYKGALRFLEELECYCSTDPSRLEIVDVSDIVDISDLVH